MIYNKSIEGSLVKVRINDEIYQARVTKYIGKNDLNPDRELIEVRFIDYVEGADPHEIIDVRDIALQPASMAKLPGQVPCWECGRYVFPKDCPNGAWDEGTGFYCGC